MSTTALTLRIVEVVALVITLFVVGYYTRETFRLRKLTKDQVDLFEEQLELQKTQARSRKAEIDRGLEERARELDPMLKLENVLPEKDSLTALVYMKKGGQMTEVSAGSEEKVKYEVSSDSDQILSYTEPFKLFFEGTGDNEVRDLRFTLSFVNEEGVERHKKYQFQGVGAWIVEEKV